MVSDMIRVYCKGNHVAYDKKNKRLCKECQALDDYARMLFVHPIACIRHLAETSNEKKKIETT